MIGVNKLSTIPCRAEASDRSEMVTQLLYGESFDILEEREKWLRVRGHRDSCESWITREQFFPIDSVLPRTVWKAWNGCFMCPKGFQIDLSPGSLLSTDEMDSVLKDPASPTSVGNDIYSNAKSFLGTPYLWGGRSKWGIDCSGFTQILHYCEEIDLPRNASEQATIGEKVAFEARKAGDLAFFINKDNIVTHVGLLLDKENIIHASGWVRIDTLDQNGIFKAEIKKYSHTLSHIQRVRV